MKRQKNSRYEFRTLSKGEVERLEESFPNRGVIYGTIIDKILTNGGPRFYYEHLLAGGCFDMDEFQVCLELQLQKNPPHKQLEIFTAISEVMIKRSLLSANDLWVIDSMTRIQNRYIGILKLDRIVTKHTEMPTLLQNNVELAKNDLSRLHKKYSSSISQNLFRAFRNYRWYENMSIQIIADDEPDQIYQHLQAIDEMLLGTPLLPQGFDQSRGYFHHSFFK